MEIDYLKSLGIGSGLDTVELVNAIVEAERAPQLAALNRRAGEVEVKISGTAQLKSALQNLQTAFSSLNDASEFNFLGIENGSSGAVTPTLIDSAAKGSHTLRIDQLATRSTFVSAEQSSTTADLNNGSAATFSFNVGSGATQTVSLEAGDVSLTALRDGINDLDAGVTARIVEVSAGSYRLFLESDQTGSDSEITVSTDLFDIAQNQKQVGVDAELLYNGVAVTRSSNQIADLIQGVNLSLTATTASSFTLNFTQDTASAKDAVVSLVDAFNEFNGVMKELTATPSEDSAGGDFAGDAIVRDIQLKVRQLFTEEGSVAGSTISRMSDMGVAIDRNGVFQIDETKLSSALINHYAEMKSFFTADTNDQSEYSTAAKGLAGDVLDKINGYLAFDGLVARYELSNARTAASLVSEEKELDAKMATYEERYVKKFTAMNAAIAEMNSLKEYLDTQLKNLPFTSNKD